MKELSQYNHTTVRIRCAWGETITGACEWNPPDTDHPIFGHAEESLKIGEALIFAGQIAEIELLRKEICVPVRDWPEAKEEITGWFQGKGKLPPEACRQSIRDCLGKEDGLPQWYVVVGENRILAGCGVIEDDPHGGNDRVPTVCAVFVEEEVRNRGLAGFLLRYVCDDMAGLGFRTLCLLTEQSGIFERYGWEFRGMVRGKDGTLSRLYVHQARETMAPE